MGSITIIPKVKEDENQTKVKKKKPSPLTWEVATLHEVKLYANDSFWDDYVDSKIQSKSSGIKYYNLRSF